MNLTNRDVYWFRLLVTASIFINVLFGGRMYESLCARAYRKRLMHHEGIGRIWADSTIWLMDLLEKGHCRKAYYAIHPKEPQGE